MIHTDLLADLRKRIEMLVGDVAKATPDLALSAVVDQYREVRVTNAETVDGDMLIDQWGSYDWGSGPAFEWSVTRQIVLQPHDGLEDDELFYQLSVVMRYGVTQDNAKVGEGNKWCPNLRELGAWVQRARAEASFQTAARDTPRAVEINYGPAG